MNHAGERQAGFALTYVLAIAAAVAAFALVLTDTTGALAFEARQAHHAACRRNLLAGGEAWARQAGRAQAGPTKLDVAALGVPGAALEVSLLAGQARVSVSLGPGLDLRRGPTTRPGD